MDAQAEEQWCYEDSDGVVHGPYPASFMRQWYEAEYFPPELRVCRAADGDWQHLSGAFADPSLAFLPPEVQVCIFAALASSAAAIPSLATTARRP